VHRNPLRRGCGKEKPISEFWDKHNICKECSNKYGREYHIRNREKRNRKSLLFNKTDKGRYVQLKARAKLHNRIVEIPFEEFVKLTKNNYCFYCGEFFEVLGLDRHINSNGYTMENSKPCCGVCNKMKMDTDYWEFIAKCTKISLNAEKVL
jgi:hypothetical protein